MQDDHSAMEQIVVDCLEVFIKTEEEVAVVGTV